MKRSEYFESINSKLHSSENLCLVNAFVESVRSVIPFPANHMFEVGCGYGLAAGHMRNFSWKHTVSDTDNLALDFIRWKFPPNAFDIQNDNDIPADADFIYFFISLYHISNYMDLVKRCIQHIIQVDGRGLAICELKPDLYKIFHKYELSPFDGLSPEDFNFINSIPDITITYEELPVLKHHGNEYQCYSLIIKPL